MVYVKKLILNNFKGYKNNAIFTFNQNKNILVGDNGIGKTTIVQALRLLLKGSRYEYNGISYLANYINDEVVNNFISSKNYLCTNLPSFDLTVIFGIEETDKRNLKLLRFCGDYQDSNGSIKRNGYGITFKYLFDENFKDEYNELIRDKDYKNNFIIPYGMYKTDHRTLSGDVYSSRMDPLKSIFIDNDSFEGNPFNIFARQIYSTLPTKKRVQVESKFGFINNNLFDDINRNDLAEYNLRIDTNSLKFDSIIDVTSGRISIKELGSGLENLLKTQLSLNQDNTDSAHLIVIEEPENHLTASNTRKQIDQLNNINNQIIVTTHNSYIVTGLDIENLIWIKEENGLKKQATITSELSEETKEFFKRRDDVDFLRLLTAKKIILVEGAAEYILMRTFIKKVCKEDRLDFEILSIGGRHYQPFIDLAKYANNKMAIFTDNDADVEKPADKRINKIDEDNKKTESVKIFCDRQTKNYTFEVSEYNSNKSIIENKFPVNSYAKTSKHGDNDVGSKQLAYMLNNKTESALAMLPNYEKEVYKIPEYIVKGLKWLKE